MREYLRGRGGERVSKREREGERYLRGRGRERVSKRRGRERVSN